MKKFGLIGYPLGHSFSKKYFTEKFEKEGIEQAQYDTYPIESIELLPAILANNPELKGLNVTIPYKELVIPYLHKKSPVVQKINACNCIKVVDGKLEGHNTDAIGFEASLKAAFPNLPSKALILGTGGAAKAVEYVLQQNKIQYKFVSRKPSAYSFSYEQVTPAVVKEYKLIINTTPLGMFPHVVEAPQIPYEALSNEHCLYDVVYNPEKTLFLQKGEERGAAIKNGLEMLVLQAEASWEIWNS